MTKQEKRSRYGTKRNYAQVRKFASFASSVSSITFGYVGRPLAEHLLPVGNYRHVRVRSTR